MESPPHEREYLVQDDTVYSKFSSKRGSHVRFTISSVPGSDLHHNARFNWLPVVLRRVPLLFLFLLAAALFGVLEYAAVHLPHGGMTLRNELGKLHTRETFEVPELHARNVLHRGLGNVAVLARQFNATTTPPPITSSAPTSYYIPETYTVISTSNAQSDYIPGAYTETTPSPIPSSAPPSNYIPEGYTETSWSPVATSTVPDAYIPGVYTETKDSPELTSTAAASNYVPGVYTETTSTEIIVEGTPPSNYLPNAITETLPPPRPVTSISDYIPDAVTATTTETIYSPSSFSTSGAYIPNAVTVTAAATEYIPDYITVTSGATTTSALVPVSNQETHGRPIAVVHKWTSGKVFLSSYLPVLIAVGFRLWWTEVHDKVTLVDPFRELSRPGGALATKAFLDAYQKRNSVLQPFAALWTGRWTLALTGIANLAASFLPALASEALFVNADWGCPHPDVINHPKTPCFPRLTASVLVVRVLQGVLLLTVAAVIFLAFALSFRRSGLLFDPSSLASIASLMQDESSATNLDAPQTNMDRSLRAHLAGKRYWLGSWDDKSGMQQYGIREMGSIGTIDQGFAAQLKTPYAQESPGYAMAKEENASDPKSAYPRWFMDGLLVVMALGTFAVVLAYYLDPHDDPFNRFFNSNTFGPRFILTGSATILAGLWKQVEHDTMTKAPFNRLCSKPSSYASTLGFAGTVTPLVSTWRAMRNRYFLVAAVTIITLLGEALNVVISGVPYSPGLKWVQFLVSAYMSIAILSLMIITSVCVMFHRKREPKIPVRPTTLAAKMSYLAGSKVLDDFRGSEWESEKQRDTRLRLLGKKYKLEPVIMDNGARKWLITEAKDRFDWN